MSAPPPPPPPVAPAPAPRPLIVRAAGNAVRVAMVLGILGAGYALLDLYRNLFTDPATPPAAPSDGPPAAPPAPGGDLRALLLDDGTWTAGGAGWAVRVTAVTPDELDRRLKAPGDPVPPGRAVADVERDLLRWAQADGTRTALAAAPGCFAYRAVTGGLSVRVVTEGTGPAERVRLGQLTWGAGTLVEFTPAPAPDGSADPLLPVPAGASVQARRWAGGALTAELVGPWDADGFPPGWSNAGWVGRPLGGDGAGHEFRRGGETVWVWRFGLPGGGGSLLVARPRAR